MPRGSLRFHGAPCKARRLRRREAVPRETPPSPHSRPILPLFGSEAAAARRRQGLSEFGSAWKIHSVQGTPDLAQLVLDAGLVLGADPDHDLLPGRGVLQR